MASSESIITGTAGMQGRETGERVAVEMWKLAALLTVPAVLLLKVQIRIFILAFEGRIGLTHEVVDMHVTVCGSAIDVRCGMILQIDE